VLQVTVPVTLAVPPETDAEDAAELVADAAVSRALEVVSAGAGVRAHPDFIALRRRS